MKLSIESISLELAEESGVATFRTIRERAQEHLSQCRAIIALLDKLDEKSPGKYKRRIKFPGIGADAAKLGVNRITLYKVLRGQWKSKTLLARYRALKATQRAR